VIKRFLPAPRGLDENGQIIFYLVLPDIFAQVSGTERQLNLGFHLQADRTDQGIFYDLICHGVSFAIGFVRICRH
jgi:hypothetical protein